MAETILLTTVQTRILDSLGTYYYLTAEQMRRLGVGSDKKHLYETLRLLHRKGWIFHQEEQPHHPKKGTLAYCYSLAPKGAEVLAEIVSEPVLEVKKKPFQGVPELPHLNAIVDSHILLRTWAHTADVIVESWTGDYQPGLARGVKATAIPYPKIEGKHYRKNEQPHYTPDGVAQIVRPNAARHIFIFEIYAGGWRYTLDHWFAKLPEARHVSETDAAEIHLKAERAARFLILFADAGMRERALARWPDRTAEDWGSFYVKDMGELAADFVGGWHRVGGGTANLL